MSTSAMSGWSNFSSGLGMQRHRYGNSEIMYGTDGRLHFPAMGGRDHGGYPQHTYAAQLPNPSQEAYRSMDFDSRRRGDTRGGDRTYGRPTSGPYRNDLPATHTFRSEPRRYQNRPLPSPREPDYLRPVGQVYPFSSNTNGYNHTGRKLGERESPWHTPINDRKDYDKAGLIAEQNRSRSRRSFKSRKEKRNKSGCESLMQDWPVTVTFMLTGSILLGLGIANVLLCTENNIYSHFWVGTMAFVTGIMGAIHKGRYHLAWASIEYFIFGVLVTLLAMVGTGFLLDSLIPTFKGLAMFDGNMENYLASLPASELEPVIKNISSVDRAWACFGVDIAHLVFLLVCYAGLIAGTVVLEKYWSSTNEFQIRIRPCSSPMTFNPFSQLPIGEVMVFMGLVTSLACEESEWTDYWSPVWAGGLTIAAGFVGAVAERQPNSKPKNRMCIVAEFLAFAATAVAVVLCTMGMIDNIQLLDDVDVNADIHRERRLIASACLFAIADIPCLVNTFYTIVIMVKSIQIIMTQEKYLDESGSDIGKSIGKSSYTRSVTSIDTTPRNGYHGYNRQAQATAAPVMMNSRWARY